MKVDYYNTYLTGGAASAAIRLFHNIGQPVANRFFYRFEPKEFPYHYDASFIKVDPVKSNSGLGSLVTRIKANLHHSKIRTALSGRPDGLEQFSTSFQFYKTPFDIFQPLPDILHLHWIAEWLDFPTFFSSLPDKIPIIWTLHDQNPMTAGCHYSWHCDQYKTKCTNCFQLGPGGRENLEMKSWKLKIKSLQNKNTHIVTDSAWLEEQVRVSMMFSKARSVRTIHYSVDQSIFMPTDRVRLREKWKINPDLFVLCFGATDISNKRKGWEYAKRVIHSLKSIGKDFLCLIFGAGVEEVQGLKEVRSVGLVKSSMEMAEIYSISDVFLLTSLEEAFGQTAIESMACGTPVIAFRTGGIMDSVRHGETGWLIEKEDVPGMVSLLRTLIERGIQDKMRIESVQNVSKNFSTDLEYKHYMELYEFVLSL